MSSASEQFFGVLAQLTFAILLASGAVEIARAFRGHREDGEYLISVRFLSGLLLLASMAPLIVSDTPSPMRIANFLFLIGSLIAYTHELYAIVVQKRGFQHPKVSLILFLLTTVAVGVLVANSIAWESIVVYKALCAWLFLVLVVRFKLAIGVVLSRG